MMNKTASSAAFLGADNIIFFFLADFS